MATCGTCSNNPEYGARNSGVSFIGPMSRNVASRSPARCHASRRYGVPFLRSCVPTERTVKRPSGDASFARNFSYGKPYGTSRMRFWHPARSSDARVKREATTTTSASANSRSLRSFFHAGSVAASRPSRLANVPPPAARSAQRSPSGAWAGPRPARSRAARRARTSAARRPRMRIPPWCAAATTSAPPPSRAGEDEIVRASCRAVENTGSRGGLVHFRCSDRPEAAWTTPDTIRFRRTRSGERQPQQPSGNGALGGGNAGDIARELVVLDRSPRATSDATAAA